MEHLLDGARAGDVTGIVCAYTMRRQRYSVDLGGLCARNVTFARGMVAALDDELSIIVRSRDWQETR